MKYDELRKLRDKNKVENICLFGAGLIGNTWAYDLLTAMNFSIDCYCDNGKKAGTEIRNGLKTISIEELYAMREKVLVFITISEKNQQSIKEQLQENGICNIVRVDYLFMQTFIESLLELNDVSINKKFEYILDDEEYISRQFKYHFGYRPNLSNPRTFNEKIQWLKLHDRDPKYTKLVDKYEVKKYIAENIGKEYIIPTLGVYDSFDEIDFEKLPRQFVLKCTHDSGSIALCKDKADFDQNMARKILESGMRRNFYWLGREWPYKNVNPRIIAEPFLEEPDQDDFIDYKFLCTNGKVKMSFTCSNRFNKDGLCVNFYDREWRPMPFERHYPRRKTEIEKPEKYEEMIEIAERLSSGIRFVRVDFYFIQGKIYVGEMTFYPGNGMEEFKPEEWDYRLGELIQL